MGLNILEWIVKQTCKHIFSHIYQAPFITGKSPCTLKGHDHIIYTI